MEFQKQLIFIPLNGYCLKVNQKLSPFNWLVFQFAAIQIRRREKCSSRMVAHTATPNLITHVRSYCKPCAGHSVLESRVLDLATMSLAGMKIVLKLLTTIIITISIRSATLLSLVGFFFCVIIFFFFGGGGGGGRGGLH